MQRPRPFSHRLIYTDERQERLNTLRSSFATAASRRKGRGVRLSTPMLLSAIVLLIAVLLLIAYSR